MRDSFLANLHRAPLVLALAIGAAAFAAPTPAAAQVPGKVTGVGFHETGIPMWTSVSAAATYRFRMRSTSPLEEWRPNTMGWDVDARATAGAVLAWSPPEEITENNFFIGSSVEMQVAGVNTAGVGAWSDGALFTSTASSGPFTSATPTAPGLPTNVSAAGVSGGITLTWTAGTGTTTRYRVRWRLTDADGAGSGTDPGAWQGWAAATGYTIVDSDDGIDTASTATSYTIRNLTAGVSYEAAVAGVNEVSASAFTGEGTATPTATSSDSTLNALSVDTGDNTNLITSFAAATLTYNLGSLANAVTSLDITATATDGGASISAATLKGTAITPLPTIASEFPLDISGVPIGEASAIVLTIAASDASTTSYTLNFTRAAAPVAPVVPVVPDPNGEDETKKVMTANAEAVAKSVSAAVVLSGVLDAVSQNAFDAAGSFTPFVDVSARNEQGTRQALVSIARQVAAPLLLSEQAVSKDMDWRDLLGASSFRLGITAGEFGDAIGGTLGGGEWSVWGSGDVRGFNGGGTVETEGLGYSVYLGTDYRKGNWLAGIAAGYSSTTADITAEDEKGEKSQSEFWLAGGYPYLRYSWQNQIDAWLLLGAGGGQLMLTDEDASAFVVSHLYAAGAKANVLQYGNLTLAAKADVAANFALSVSTTDNLNDFDTMQQRVRVGVDVAYDYRGATHAIRPHLEVGARLDFGGGGDIEIGDTDLIPGAEVAGGVRYEFQPLRLSVDVRGRALVYDTTGLLREWGAGATIRLAPNGGGTGLSASLTPGWGAPQSRTDNMWQDNTPALTQTTNPAQALTLRGELAYTFKHKQARITPLTQYALTTQSQTVAIGTRLNLAPLALEVLGEHITTQDDYRLRLNTSLRF